MNLVEKIIAASNALDRDDVMEAARLVAEAEAELTSITDRILSLNARSLLGGVMIDLGSWTRNHAMVKQGTDFAMQVISDAPTEKVIPGHFYNAANGYSSIWQIRVHDALQQGVFDQSHIEAKRLYRKAIDLANQSPSSIDADLRKQLLVNYANCLDTVGRCVEAVTEYDKVLKTDSTMAPALGNKGMVLHRLAYLARGHTHTFLLEAHRLLDAALRQPLNEHTKKAFRRHHDQLKKVISTHSDMKPEQDERNHKVDPIVKTAKWPKLRYVVLSFQRHTYISSS